MEQAKQLTNEQLIELLESKKDEQIDASHLQEDDVSSFLSFYNISTGSDEIKLSELYKLYKNWSVIPIKQLAFNRYLDKTFQINNKTILINQSKANINQLLVDKLNSKKDYITKSKIVHSKVEDFLNHYQIKDGNVWTKESELYKLYSEYHHNIGVKKFSKLLQLYITTSEIINNERHFKITPYEKEETNEKG